MDHVIIYRAISWLVLIAGIAIALIKLFDNKKLKHLNWLIAIILVLGGCLQFVFVLVPDVSGYSYVDAIKKIRDNDLMVDYAAQHSSFRVEKTMPKAYRFVRKDSYITIILESNRFNIEEYKAQIAADIDCENIPTLLEILTSWDGILPDEAVMAFQIHLKDSTYYTEKLIFQTPAGMEGWAEMDLDGDGITDVWATNSGRLSTYAQSIGLYYVFLGEGDYYAGFKPSALIEKLSGKLSDAYIAYLDCEKMYDTRMIDDAAFITIDYFDVGENMLIWEGFENGYHEFVRETPHNHAMAIVHSAATAKKRKCTRMDAVQRTRIRPPGSACQPESGSPARTLYAVLRPVFVGPCSVFFENQTGFL